MMGISLRNIANVTVGNSAPTKDEFSKKGIPFIRAGSLEFLVRGISIETCELIDPALAKEKRMRLFPKGSILFAKSGMSAKMGRIYVLPKDAYVVSHIAVITIINDNINSEYIAYYLNYRPPFNLIKDDAYPSISITDIKNIEIPLPDLETQNRIVAILDKVKVILNKREKTIQKYDELLRATFGEMFGSKNTEFKHWEDVEIGSFKKNERGSMRTGPFGSSLKHERFKEVGDVAVLGIDNAVDNIFKWKQKRYLKISEFEEFKRYQVFPRDVIITIMGTVGRSAVIPEDIGLAINTKHLAALTLDENKCNPYYLAYSIHSNSYIKYQLKTRARGAVMDGFNLTLIKELKLKNAPINLQNKFEYIYLRCSSDIEKLKVAKDKLEMLFNALSQLAFKNELKFNTAIDLEVLLENDYKFFKENLSAKSIHLLLERLVKDELNDKKFYEPEIYDKAKGFVFDLLKEGQVIQVFDENNNCVKLGCNEIT